ncbi:phage tail tape measure protein [Saccharothrix hoggarensis]|uniref:Phage tail tape measure protein n=1 Tax=Saccharothrix hoggarensis TaxID=913853 RepID=A0ABW3QIQ1_9PSEU
MSQEVADLYIKLSSNARSLIPDFTAAGRAGEGMAKQVRGSTDNLDRAYNQAAIAAQTTAKRTSQAIDQIVASYQRAGTAAAQLAARVKASMAAIVRAEKGAADAATTLEAKLRKSVDALVVSHERAAKSQLRLEAASAATAAKVAAAQDKITASAAGMAAKVAAAGARVAEADDKIAASAAGMAAKVAAAGARVAEADHKIAASAAGMAAKVAAANDRIVASNHRTLASEAAAIARVEQASAATVVANNRAAASHASLAARTAQSAAAQVAAANRMATAQLTLERRTTETALSIVQAHTKAAKSGVDLEKALRRQVDAQTEAGDLIVRSHGVVSRSMEETALKQRDDVERMRAQTIKLASAFEEQERKATAANYAMAEALDDTAGRSIKSLEGKRQALADTAVALTMVATVATGMSVKMAGDFELGTTRLVTSAGELRSNLDMVRDGLLRMSGEVGYNTNELINALIRVNSAGYHGAEGLDILRSAAQGAKAENADLVTVADAVTSVMADYRHMGYSAADVTTKLIVATSQGKTTMQELAGSLSAVLPIASSAKISFEDIVGAQASMTVHGMSARQAAQNLADAIRHMLAPTQVQAKELGQLGLSAQDLAQMVSEKGLTGTLNLLSQTILSKMGPSGKVMLDAFNQSKDAAAAVNDMIKAMPKPVADLAIAYRDGTISLGDYKAAMKALPSDQAGLAKQFMSLSDRASGFTDLLKQGTPAAQSYQDALRRVMGDATGLNVALMLTGHNTAYTTEAVKNITAATADASGNVLGWTDIQETFNQSMSEATAGVQALATKVGMELLPGFRRAMDVVSKATSWLLEHEGAARGLATAIGVGLVLALSVATAWVWSFAAAMWATGIPQVIIAITAIGIALYALADRFDLVERLVKPFARWMRGLFAELREILTPWINLVKFELIKTWHAFVEEIREHAPVIKHYIAVAAGHARDMLDKLRAWLQDNGPAIKEHIKEAFRIFRDYVIPTVVWFATKLFDLWRTAVFVWTAIGKVVMYFVELVIDIVDGLKTFFKGWIDFFRGVFTGDWSLVWKGLQGIFSGFFKILLALAKFGLKSLGALFQGFGKGLAQILGVDLDRVHAKFTDGFIESGQKVNRIMESLGLEVPAHLRLMDRLGQKETSTFKDNLAQRFMEIKYGAVLTFDELKDRVTDKLGLIGDATNQGLDFIRGLFGRKFGLAKGDSEIALESFRVSSSGIMGRLSEQLGIDLEGIRSKFAEKFGQSKISGEQMLQGLKDAASALLRSMAEALGIDLDMIVLVFRSRFGQLKTDSEIAMESFREGTAGKAAQTKTAVTAELEAMRLQAEAKLLASRLAAEREMGRTVVISSDSGSALRRIFGEAWEAVRSGTVSKLGDVLGFLTGVPGSITRIFGGSSGWLWSHGNGTLSGFLSGLKSKWAEVVSFIVGIGPWIQANKGPLDVDRKLLIPAGDAIMSGLLTALKAGGDRVRRFVREFTKEIAASASGSGAIAGNLTITAKRPDDGENDGAPRFTPGPSGGGGGGQVVNVKVVVEGTVIAERDLQRAVQQTVLRYAVRNAGPGLNPAFGG